MIVQSISSNINEGAYITSLLNNTAHRFLKISFFVHIKPFY